MNKNIEKHEYYPLPEHKVLFSMVGQNGYGHDYECGDVYGSMYEHIHEYMYVPRPPHSMEDDIQLIARQTNCSLQIAKDAYKKNNGDIVNAIMSLS